MILSPSKGLAYRGTTFEELADETHSTRFNLSWFVGSLLKCREEVPGTRRSAMDSESQQGRLPGDDVGLWVREASSLTSGAKRAREGIRSAFEEGLSWKAATNRFLKKWNRALVIRGIPIRCIDENVRID